MRDITPKTVTAYRWVARPIAGDHTSGVSVAAFAFFIFIASLFLFGTSPVLASNGKMVLTCPGKIVYEIGDTILYTFTVDNTSTTFGGPFNMENVDCRLDLPPCVGHPTGASISETDRDGNTFTLDIRVYYDMNIHQVFSNPGTIESGSNITITVDAVATVAGECTSRAWYTTDTFDPDTSDNEDSCTFQVTNLSLPTMDFGDAPAPYPTLLEDDGARHVIVDGGARLIDPPDSEADGQPHQDALGDDEAGSDDEGGIRFWLPPLLPGTDIVYMNAGNVTDRVEEGGYVNAWIDFNIDGDWADPEEQIITDEWLDPYAGKEIEFTVPPVTPEQESGTTFARFRISSQKGLSYTGMAPDGEVEDIATIIYMEEKISLSPSTASSPVGTEHTVTAKVYELHPNDRKVTLSGREVMFNVLGPNYEVEPHTAITDDNGNATFTYRGNKVGIDEIQVQFTDRWENYHQVTAEKEWTAIPTPDISVDELLVQFGDTIVGVSSDKKVTVSNPGDTRLHVTSIELTGDDSSDFSVLGTGDDPNDLGPGDTLILESGHESSIFLRFLPVDTGDKSATLRLATNVPGQELVDIEFRGTATQVAVDFGDAPTPYPTLLKDNGAEHIIEDGVYLGSGVDAEDDGQPGEFADGDDRSADDEDGVRGTDTIEWPMIPGRKTDVTVTASTSGFLNAWVDFNRDGKWDEFPSSEQIAHNEPLNAGLNRLIIDVPSDAKLGETFVRFRFSTTPDLPPEGLAGDGEVEDYWHMISQPQEYIEAVSSSLGYLAGLGRKEAVTARVMGPDSKPIAERVVTFTITDGPHKGLTRTNTTDGNGFAYFEYRGTKPGTDVIMASFVDSEGEKQISNQVEIEWVQPALPDKGSSETPAAGAIGIKGKSSGAKGVLHKVGGKDAVIIGYSGPHEDGDASDTGGTPVGTMGTIISDADFPLVPPGFQGPPGTREAHTEIRELSMSNADGVAIRAGTGLGLPLNPGEMESLSGASGDSELDFPAQSFFDVFLEIDLPETAEHPVVTIYNSDPLLLINNAIEFPSRMIYVTGNDSAIPLYYRDSHPDGDWSADDLFGWLTTAAIGVDFDPDNPDDAREFEDEALKLSDLPILAPVVLDIPDQSIEAPNEFVSIKLDDYVSDPDNEDSEMVWTFDGSTKLIVSIKERVATIALSDIAWAGSETVTFTVKDPDGLSDSKSVTFTVTQPTTSVDPDGKALGTWGILRRTALYQNYPNPFNPDTWIPYQVAEDTDAVIRISDASGRIIRTLELGYKPTGFYATKDKAAYWDGRNGAGESVASGIYFYSITAGDYTATRKMTVRR